MTQIRTEDQLIAELGGPQPGQIAMSNLIRSMFARKEGAVDASESVAGLIGEFLSTSVLVADKLGLVTDTPKTIAALALTPGDWDVSGIVVYVPAATTAITFLRQSISVTTNVDGDAIASSADHGHTPGVTNLPVCLTPPVRVNIAAGASYFLVAHAIFATDVLSAYGTIRARRVR